MNRTIGLLTANYTVAGFGDLTAKRPPATVPFDGRFRLMDYALSNMVNARIDNVGLITPYYYRSILDHVGAGKDWGLDKKIGGLFILPGTVFGAKEDDSARFLFRDICLNERYLQKGDADYVLISACSMVFNVDYQAMIAQHELSGRDITFLYKKGAVDHKGQFLTINANGGVSAIETADKGENLFLDAFIINKTYLMRLIRDYRHQGYLDMVTILKDNLPDISAGSFAFDGYVGFTDGLDDYMKTSRQMLDPAVRRQVYLADRPVITSAHDTTPSLYQPGSSVRCSALASGGVVEGTVENSILFRNVQVKKGAVVRNAVIMDSCVIGENARVENVVCDKNVVITAGVCVAGTEDHPCLIAKDVTV